MGRFLAKRAAQAILVIGAVATLTFALAHAAPGDPFLGIDDPRMTEAQRQQLRHQWGADEPVPRQYVRWLANFARGDFGWSYLQSRPVSDVLRDVVPASLILAVPAIVLGVLAGVAFGTWNALRHDRAAGRAADAVALVFISVPDFVVALAVLSLFAVHWGLAPTAGMTDPVNHDSMSALGRIADMLAHLALPCLTLAAMIAATVARYHRAAVLDVLREDYVRTARATGAPERAVLFRHVFRNALGPVIALTGLIIPGVFAGAVFVETVFAWPGLGSTIVEAVGRRDYPLVQACAIVAALVVVAAALAADIIAAAVNPRLRLDA